MFWPFPQLPHGGNLSLSSSSTTDQLQFVQQYRPFPGFVPTFIATLIVFGSDGGLRFQTTPRAPAFWPDTLSVT